MRTCEHGHAAASGETGIDAFFILISPHCCVQPSAGTSAGRQPWHRETPLGWIRRPGEGRRNLLQERRDGLAQEQLLGEGQAWMEAAGLPRAVPALLHLLASRTRSLCLVPAGISPSCPPPQPTFPPGLQLICLKCRGKEQSLPQTQEGEQPLVLDPCFPLSFPLF